MVLVMKQDCSGNLLSSGSVRAGVIGQQSKQVLPDNSEVAASGVTQTVRLPRRRSAASYSAQFPILYWAGLRDPVTTRFIGLVRHQGSRDQWATSILFRPPPRQTPRPFLHQGRCPPAIDSLPQPILTLTRSLTRLVIGIRAWRLRTISKSAWDRAQATRRGKRVPQGCSDPSAAATPLSVPVWVRETAPSAPML